MSVSDALVEIPVWAPDPLAARVEARVGGAGVAVQEYEVGLAEVGQNGPQRNGKATRGSLAVLTSGLIPPTPGEFVGRRVVKEIIAELADRADFVLLDAPPILQIGDALTLSSAVDAMVVITRMDVVRRRTLTELHRLLAACPAEKLGFVVTAAGREESLYGYGYHGYYYRPYTQNGRHTAN
jgi:Mrp family chromosome partitioning ATPase